MNPGVSALLLCAVVIGGASATLVQVASGDVVALVPPKSSRPLVQFGDPERSGVDAFVRGISVGLRRTVRRSIATLRGAARAWGRYARRGARWIALALLVGVLDRNLLAAWRSSGLRVLVTYVPLMLYVNFRLFFDRRVFWLGKLLVLSSIAYGIWRYDFIPDRRPLPGYVDDALLIIIATRLFLAWSGDEVIFEHASAAVKRWERMMALQRSRR